MGIRDWFKPKQKGISDTYFDLKRPATALLGGDATTLVNEYQQLPVVYAAVNAIAMRAASVDPVFYRTGTDTVVDNHPAIDRLHAPFIGWNWTQFIQAWVISKKVYGEFLAIKSQDLEKNVPISLKVAKYGTYRPSFESGEWAGWMVDDKPYTREDVLYDKYPNPWDSVRGLSPLMPARVANETEWAARRFNKRFFDNDATPGGYFKSPMGLTEPQRQRLKSELIESRKGRESAHSWLLLEGDTEVTQLGLSHRDSQFIEQFSQTLHDVCGVLQVDPACIGFEKESKYASAKEARKYLWTDAVLPTLRSIEGVINKQFLRPYNITLFFDTEGVEALQDNFHETVSTAEKLVKMGVPFNAVNVRLDLGFEPIPGGDEPRVDRSPMLLDHEPHVKETVIGSLPDNGGYVDVQRAADGMVWKAINDEVAGLVSGLNRRLKRFFFDVKKKLERQVKSVQKDITGDAIDAAISFEKLAEIIVDFLNQAGLVGWKQVTGSGSISQLPQGVLNVVAQRISYVKEITQHARDEVSRFIDAGLREITERAILEGWTEAQRTQAILEKLDGAIDNLQSRARTIARTEVHAAHSQARYEAMVETEPVAKRWVASPGENTRDSHIDAMNEGVIPFSDTFKSVGMQYPMEPGGDPGEVINCRCVMVPIYEGQSEAGGLRNE